MKAKWDNPAAFFHGDRVLISPGLASNSMPEVLYTVGPLWKERALQLPVVVELAEQLMGQQHRVALCAANIWHVSPENIEPHVIKREIQGQTFA